MTTKLSTKEKNKFLPKVPILSYSQQQQWNEREGNRKNVWAVGKNESDHGQNEPREAGSCGRK